MCSWERAVDYWADDDPTKKAIGKDLVERFKSVLALVNHARDHLSVFTDFLVYPCSLLFAFFYVFGKT